MNNLKGPIILFIFIGAIMVVWFFGKSFLFEIRRNGLGGRKKRQGPIGGRYDHGPERSGAGSRCGGGAADRCGRRFGERQSHGLFV